MAVFLCDDARDPPRRLVKEADALLRADPRSTVLLVCSGGSGGGGNHFGAAPSIVSDIQSIPCEILRRVHVKYVSGRSELLPFLKNFQLLPRHQHCAILVSDPDLALLAGAGGKEGGGGANAAAGGGNPSRGAMLMEALALLCNAAGAATRDVREDRASGVRPCKVVVALAAAGESRNTGGGGNDVHCAGDGGDTGLVALLSHWLPIVRIVPPLRA